MSFVFKFINGSNHVFIHIPKNGGTAITKSLAKYNRYRNKLSRPDQRFVGHLTYLETKKLFKDNTSNRYFASVRNPWDRMVSFYHYIKQNKVRVHGIADLKKVISNGATFEQFVDAFILSDNKISRPQIAYLLNESGEIGVDFVLRVEHSEEDFKALTDKFNLTNLPLITTNTSNHGEYRQYYKTQELIDKVADFDAGVIKEYNYCYE